MAIDKPLLIETVVETSDQLTIGDTTFKTTGNILFHGGEQYVLAESQLMEKMDKAIQVGILENGMQSLLKKIKIT
jgi:hypothetical protein